MNFHESNEILKKYDPQSLEFILAYDWSYLSKILINMDFEWSDKIDALFWRGRVTDTVYPTPSPREYLTRLSQHFPQHIDAATINSISRMQGQRTSNFVSIYDHLKFKYQIAMDGITSQYPGLAWRLLSNSLVFKQESHVSQWFEAGLTDGVHYVKVDNYLSDLIEKIHYYQAHDDEAKMIAENAQKFAQSNIMPEHIIDYCYKVLLKYISLQKFSKSFFENFENYELVSDPLTSIEKESRRHLIDQMNTAIQNKTDLK